MRSVMLSKGRSMHPLVEHILKVCREHGVHPLDMSRARFRELTKDPVIGMKKGSARFIEWAEAKRRATVDMVDEQDELDPCIPIVAHGLKLSGTTTLTRNTRGEPVYVKTKADDSKQAKAEALKDIARSLVEIVEPREWTIPTPILPGPKDAFNIHVFGDPHFGMRADGEETGGMTWGLADAIKAHDAAIDVGLVTGPRAETGMLLYQGDNTHADNSAGTTTKGTPLDVDVTHKEATTAFRNHWIRATDRAMTVYKQVILRIVAGNHDWDTAWMMMLLAEAHYRNEPRVKVVVSKEPADAHIFGDSIIVTNHGDKLPRKPEELAKWASNRWPKEWGAARYHYVFEGHVHHTKVYPLSHGEGRSVYRTFPTLAPPDGWHAGKGYVATQTTHKLTFDRRTGLRTDSIYPIEALIT